MRLRRLSPDERQQRRVEAAINMQAGGAAEKVLDHLSGGDSAPFRFNAGPPVKPLTREEYSQRVGTTALMFVGSEVKELPITYDPDASQQATDEFPAVTLHGRYSKAPGDVIVVFTDARELS